MAVRKNTIRFKGLGRKFRRIVKKFYRKADSKLQQLTGGRLGLNVNLVKYSLTGIISVATIFLFTTADNIPSGVETNISAVNDVRTKLASINEQTNKLASKLEELRKQQQKLIQQQEQLKEKAVREIQNIDDLDLKEKAYKRLLGFVPNKYLLTHKYYKAPVAKVLINPKQVMLNWRVNSDGASKPYISLQGITNEERLKYLLSLYNLKDTYKYWENMEKEYKIRKELLVCIARADTDLGTQLKSKNNIGNVGNNDRGDVVHFHSIEAGIRAMARTLNNRYLGGYTMVGQLSEGGRRNLGLPSCKEGGVYCYATSSENWNVNVLNCLSMVYNKPIDEKFNFRVNNQANITTDELASK